MYKKQDFKSDYKMWSEKTFNIQLFVGVIPIVLKHSWTELMIWPLEFVADDWRLKIIDVLAFLGFIMTYHIESIQSYMWWEFNRPTVILLFRSE